MKLRNKKTGEIIENAYIRESHDFYNKRTIAVFIREGNHPPERISTGYETLAELNAEWEDVPEEPKGYWWIDTGSIPMVRKSNNPILSIAEDMDKEIGNYFESEEEAKRAVEKLKAWKRLKDKGFGFCCDIKYESLCGNGFNIPLNAIMPPEAYTDAEVRRDLDLLFGGGDE